MSSNIYIKKKLYIVFAIIILKLIYSCDNEQVEKKYKDYNSAFTSGVLEAGWIPKEVLSEDMSDIYLRTNVDLNTCFFVFATSENKIDSINGLLSLIKCQAKKPTGIDVPEELIKKIERLDFYFLNQKNIRDSVFIAVDRNAKMIFGIRK